MSHFAEQKETSEKKQKQKKKEVSSEFVKMKTTHLEVLLDISFDYVSSLQSMPSTVKRH